jgi:predicted alpha-1,6-mannanase (GH76 family)
VLPGLSKLYNYTNQTAYLHAAESLIDSVLASPLVTSDVLVESCDPSHTCDEDQWMFKGVFMQQLGHFLTDIAVIHHLNSSTKKRLLRKYQSFVTTNAEAVWHVARAPDGKFGNWWAAPSGEQSQAQFAVETTGSGVASLWCAVQIDRIQGSLWST